MVFCLVLFFLLLVSGGQASGFKIVSQFVFAWLFLMIGFRLCILAGVPQKNVSLLAYIRKHLMSVAVFVMLSLIIWLRRSLPGFFPGKLLFLRL